MVFALVYVVAVEQSSALFTYHPITYSLGLGVQAPADGPTYFGFVRDAHNTAIGDVKVTLKITGGLTYVTRTDRAGLYRVPGLGKQIKAADVAISCAKEGYEELRVVRRPPARGKAVKSVDTECRMQRR